ncbi:hypothetical protein [Actinacidiphila sp. bgisy160]|uniref:hypothetical protein n=1 Tax=Actinacidiphila sp. bgisy160 TaxID=3413796 RepID=UPI003D753FE2
MSAPTLAFAAPAKVDGEGLARHVAAVRKLIAAGVAEQRDRGRPVVEAAPEHETATVDEHQRLIFAQAWRNSLVRARHTSYAGWRLDDQALQEDPTDFRLPGGDLPLLDDHQHPAMLRGWLDRLAAGTGKKRHVIGWGGVGSGKSTALIALGNAAVRAGIMTRYVRHGDYLRWTRPDGAPPGMTALQVREFHDRAGLLILDELCGEMDGQATEFARRETADLIDARSASGLPTAFGTNVTFDHVAAVLGSRFASRIGQNALVLEFQAPDRRAPVRWGRS